MKQLLLIILAITLTACEAVYDTDNGSISNQGEILNPELLKYAQTYQGVFHGNYVDARGTYIKSKDFFTNEYDKYAAVLKLSIENNKPKMEILLKNDVMPTCSVEFLKLLSINTDASSLKANWSYKNSCDKELNIRRARLTIRINKETQKVEGVFVYGLYARNKTLLFK